MATKKPSAREDYNNRMNELITMVVDKLIKERSETFCIEEWIAKILYENKDKYGVTMLNGTSLNISLILKYMADIEEEEKNSEEKDFTITFMCDDKNDRSYRKIKITGITEKHFNEIYKAVSATIDDFEKKVISGMNPEAVNLANEVEKIDNIASGIDNGSSGNPNEFIDRCNDSTDIDSIDPDSCLFCWASDFCYKYSKILDDHEKRKGRIHQEYNGCEDCGFASDCDRGPIHN